MKKVAIRICIFFGFLRCLPHLLFYNFCSQRDIIHYDVKRWVEILGFSYLGKQQGFIYLMQFHPEYRNLFYKRIGIWRYSISFICPPMSTLFICTNDIGKGLFIQHGFSTIIAAKSIGDNCWINQQVTIGYTNATDCPVIKDSVSVGAGAKVIGKVIMHENSVAGANSVVVKDVPANCTVVGIPAYIVKRDGKKGKRGTLNRLKAFGYNSNTLNNLTSQSNKTLLMSL